MFSAIFCISGTRFDVQGYAILESLALVGIYNGAVTAYFLSGGKKFSSSVLYMDIIMLMLLTFFSGGIKSELYVFLFFIIGCCAINNEVRNTMKAGLASVALYSFTCIFAGSFLTDGVNYTTLIIRDLLFLMTAFGVSRINYEVKRQDEMRRKEFKIARTDRLTGLANRHYFDQKLKEEVENALYEGSVINVLMFDLDNFKGFNDTYGHVCGDKLLVLFADIIKQCIRKSDIPVRYGGEEFMILISDMDMIIAKSVGDRIRRQLEKQRIYLGDRGERIKVTVSCGIAQFPTHSPNISEVIEKTDEALYYAKHIGKNIVVCFNDIGKSRELLENEYAQ